VKLPKTSG